MNKTNHTRWTFRALIEQWDTIADFAAAIGVGYEAAKKMKDRDRISDEHWEALVSAARHKGITLTIDELYKMKANRRRARVRPPNERASARTAA